MSTSDGMVQYHFRDAIGGFFERTFAPKGLARIYDDVLANLEQVVRA